MHRHTNLSALLVAAGTLFCTTQPAPAQERGLLATAILDTADIHGGLAVHVSCGEGDLLEALGAQPGFLVQGLDADPEAVAAARQRIRNAGLYGKVSVDAFDGEHLPYIDNLVNVLVAGVGCQVSVEEMRRVLAPGGVALRLAPDTRNPTPEILLRKPWPESIDQWTHYLHDASNNAVAQDTQVGPPRHVQWIGTPDYLRHHDHMSGLSAMVSAKGRLFYIIDLGPRWSVQMPPQWTLIARDAFNGVILWQRPIPQWHAHLWPLKKGPADLMRRLIAVDDVVYVTLGVGQPVTALDAATGRELQSYAGTEGAEEMILHEGVLFALVNPALDAYRDLPRETVESIRGAGRDWNWDEKPRQLVALEPATGRVLWTKETPVAPVTLSAAGGRVYFHDGQAVHCLNATGGEPLWASKPLPRWNPLHVLFGPSLVIYDDVALFAGGEGMDPIRGGRDSMTALSTDSGKVLWTAPHPPSGYASAEDLLVVDDLVWCGETTNRRDSGIFTGRDLHSGEVVREFPPDDWQPHMPHHRCYRAKATTHYILTSRTGIEFIDVRDKHWTAHHWVRGSCNYGILPCNGLVYAPPHSCACYLLAKLNGLNALAPERESEGESERELKSERVEELQSQRLKRGPAYSRTLQSPASSLPSSAWPTYRGDGARSGSTSAAVPTDLRLAWTADIGGRLSSPVIAGGRLFVASIDDHAVHAINASTGQRLWSFTTGARVDSPPTIWRGSVLFGSADGSVYCLRAEDGTLAWQFRAAPEDLRLMAAEQIESAWPVHGSVLVRDGVVYCVAGRSMWLDGGLRLLRLNADTGELLSETTMDDKYPGTEENLQAGIVWPNLPVALPDILSTDDRYVYMRSQPFDFAGNRPEVITPRNYKEQQGESAHLFCPTGFLDDSWWHRTYWMYGRSFIGGAGGWYTAAYQAPSGRILAIDQDTVFGFGRVPLGFVGTPNQYHLFACPTEPTVTDGRRPAGPGSGGKVAPGRLTYHWSEAVPLLVRAMTATGQSLFVAGPPVEADETAVYQRYATAEIQAQMAEQVAAFAGHRGGLLMAVSKQDGGKQSAYRLPSCPVFDGLAAIEGALFVSTMDGTVLCLRGDGDQPLEQAADVEPSPVVATSPGFAATESHPDFQYLKSIHISESDLGYRMESDLREGGYALRQLATPITKQARLKIKIRPRPGQPPETPGNGFLAFGDSTDAEELIHCGFRISGQRLFLQQGSMDKNQTKSVSVEVKANEVIEIEVQIDLKSQTVTATMKDATIEADLVRQLDSITWIGHCIASVEADFSKVELTVPDAEQR